MPPQVGIETAQGAVEERNARCSRRAQQGWVENEEGGDGSVSRRGVQRRMIAQPKVATEPQNRTHRVSLPVTPGAYQGTLDS